MHPFSFVFMCSLLFKISSCGTGGGEGARSLYCGDCSSFTITSTGPAAQLHSNSFGTYTKEGSFWEDMIPYFKKRGSTDKYFTVHPNANIQFYYVPWVVSDRAVDPVNDLSHISLKTQDREGVVCPWHTAFDGLVWEYRTEGDTWLVDPTVTVQCVAFT